MALIPKTAAMQKTDPDKNNTSYVFTLDS
jgi:hypothetical protein